jgi:uncharacterized protein YecT (DUF1311 family)
MRIFLSIIFLLSSYAYAVDCESISSNMSQINDCNYQQSYIPVKNKFDILMQILETKHANEQIEVLKKAQSAWDKYSDLSCQYVVFSATDQIPADAETNCSVNFNVARTKILNKYIQDESLKSK